MNYKIPFIIAYPIMLLSCSQAETEAKQLKCSRLVDAMIVSTKAAIPNVPANRAQNAKDVLKVFEKNKEAFIKTCLKKSGSEITKMFDEIKTNK